MTRILPKVQKHGRFQAVNVLANLSLYLLVDLQLKILLNDFLDYFVYDLIEVLVTLEETVEKGRVGHQGENLLFEFSIAFFGSDLI